MLYNLLPWNPEGQWGKWTEPLLRPSRFTCLQSAINTTHYLNPLKFPFYPYFIDLSDQLHSFAPFNHCLLSLLDKGLWVLMNLVPLFLSWIVKANLPSFLHSFSNSPFPSSHLPLLLPLVSPFLAPPSLYFLSPSLPLFSPSSWILWVCFKLTVWQTLLNGKIKKAKRTQNPCPLEMQFS